VNYRSTFVVLAMGMLFSGCSTPWDGLAASLPSNVDAATARGLNLIDPSQVKAQIAVTFENDYQVSPALIYGMGNRKNRKPFCEITPEFALSGSPSGDSDGNLWLPVFYFGNSYIQSQVVQYAPDCGKPILTLQDSYSSVADVYVASDGTVYVANFAITTVSAGTILVYQKGKTAPSETLGEGNNVYFIGVASYVKKHDVFATYSECDSCNDGLMIFKNNSETGVPIKDPSLFDPGIPTVDKRGVVLVPDRSTLRTYSSPYSKPGRTYELQGSAVQCSLNKSQSNIACGDWENSTVDVYAYPTMKYSYSFSKGFQSGGVWGVAQTPN
jgi:hypothetical protein